MVSSDSGGVVDPRERCARRIMWATLALFVAGAVAGFVAFWPR
jgi:hypothetical protein